MTTSSDHQTPSPQPPGDNWSDSDHWDELTAPLSSESTEEFGSWISDELEVMLCELDAYVTPNSLKKSLRR